jgi:hypothetical protein
VLAGEVWLDVGGRCEGTVFDHHCLSAEANSAVYAVRRGWRGLLSWVEAGQAPTLVLHRLPDLDAVAAAWLVTRVLRDGGLPEPSSILEQLVRIVGDHDQGRTPACPPERDWATVVTLALGLERGDEQRAHVGIEIIERSFALLAGGRGMEATALAVSSARVVSDLREAQRRYVQDRVAGAVFGLSLPLVEHGVAPDLRALSLRAPRSALFKHLARTDPEAPGGAGWALLLVSRPVHRPLDQPALWRHVISVNPGEGYHLRGLGPHLDRLERQRWAEGDGLPRWYDGVGHGYTIVDSPAIRIEGRDLLTSRLEPATVIAALTAGVWISGRTGSPLSDEAP